MDAITIMTWDQSSVSTKLSPRACLCPSTKSSGTQNVLFRVQNGSVPACTARPLYPQERTSPGPGRSSFYRSCLKPSLSHSARKNALASSRACARDGDVVPLEIFGWPVVRESHHEAPAHGRARKAPATRADAGGDRSNDYWYIRIGGKG